MGDENALAQESDSTEEQELEGSEDQEGTEDSNESEGAEGSEEEQSEKSEEFEIVLEGAGSQPDKQHGFRKRVNKLNDRIDEAKETASQAQTDLANSETRAKLLELALQQEREKNVSSVVPPDPDDFDDGVRDPKYVAAFKAFNQPAIVAAVKEHIGPVATEQPAPVDPNIERSQRKHYERADGLGARDYDETEDKAIAILGKDVAKHIIQSSDKSEQILYFLGKNPGEAEEIRELIEANSIKGVLRIGQLEASLSVKSKANRKPAPNPDEDLQGGSPSTKRRGPKGATYA